jgi:peptide/nickel transport system permease protein
MKLFRRRFSFWAVFKSMSLVTKMCSSWLFVLALAAIFADLIPGLDDPNYQAWLFDTTGKELRNDTPSWNHLLGTDVNGRDILARLIYGARVSLAVVASGVSCGVIFGGLFGSFVGYVRGKREAAVMAAIDVVLAFPGLVLLLTIITFVGSRDLKVLCIIIGVLSIPVYTRVARANALTISRREFVAAAEALGTKQRTILVKEIVPNVLPTVLAYALVAAAVLVALEGALAFLGLSVESPSPSWGNMINLARADLRVTIWPAVWPSLALVFTVFSLNNVGDFIRQRAQKRAAAI